MLDHRPEPKILGGTSDRLQAADAFSMPRTGKQLRRSPRRHVRLPVLVRYCDRGGTAHEENAETGVVGAYGALLFLAHSVAVGQSIEIVSLRSWETTLARVVWAGGFSEDGRVRVGIDLAQPSYSFWGVWIVNLTEFFVGLAASLGAVVMGLVIFGEAVSSVQKAEYILATWSVFVGAGFWAFPVVWTLSLTRWRRYHPENAPTP